MRWSPRFADRRAAGTELAEALSGLEGPPVVLGLPRGGVALAAVVAETRGWQLDMVVVQKVGFPGQPELAVAAMAEGGVVVPNEDLVPRHLSRERLGQLVEATRPQLEARVRDLRRGRPPAGLTERSAVIVDDGIATGVTTLAAVRAAKARGATELTLAVPVAPADAAQRFEGEVDRYLVLEAPSTFRSVGSFYGDFAQVSTEEVVALLDR